MHNEDENIDDTKLRQLNAGSGFSVPIGYFERLKHNILSRTTEDEQGNQAGFEIPDGYFEHSRNLILSKTIANNILKPALPLPKVWYRHSIVRFAAAALVIFSIPVIFRLNKPNQGMTQVEISDEEIIRYFEQTDVRDIPMNEVSFASTTTDMPLPVTIEESYIINQTDEQSIIEEL